MKKLKILKISLMVVLIAQFGALAILLITPQTVLAKQNIKTINFTPQVPIPGFLKNGATSTAIGTYKPTTGIISSTLLARYIKALYQYGLAIGGILAAIVLMGGGVLWLISAGNDSKVTQAKELISGSVIGLIILFSSWLLLKTINPNLIKMETINTKAMPTEFLARGCCTEKKKSTTYVFYIPSKECTNAGGSFQSAGVGSCKIPGCCIRTNLGNNNTTYNNSQKSDCPEITSKYTTQGFDKRSCIEVKNQ